ncbi:MULTISPECIES: UDP-glucose--hexose-1-phosphate uridylyltransferase [Providencia]|uniref:Galactose-1-phosphate uridylyltransferase n=1 Tax=Providencia huaxiensis TaxID=2027290 RepID=A0ABU2J1Q8_9GAMM|nr:MULTISPECIES: UDP-glucose--hexose-1-phosphate uridylyltransferase [Providencia]MBZ3681769.1 UDP-glucose--hexose-1-phosphate uridylyltransferase [Providencia rettgeri]AXH63823.1 UDP-glucose--hexose-1-phosphate uridylyltransferase [Providencia huaxiensis]MBN6360291.1 UDP-glucose--hexose-1-phosphate uridylyltransferase [Providencia huaxiensis]MBQ0532848.1 UDP-glucose--hexose-1-phosphate uridylyltransferase [Providencia huaxiensis]MBQ0587314.1 UDP-glucose--hexose-1-phosphate uridylyltransferase
MSLPKFDPTEVPHRRYNPLTDQWVLVSPHRAKRPWNGMDEAPEATKQPEYDEKCFLCPTNKRVSGEINPDYKGTFVFQNDFSALTPQGSAQPENITRLLRTQAVRGLSRVICFSPDHSKTLPELSVSQIKDVVKTWNEQLSELGEEYLWVQAFENKGEMMGCSQPHPHGQIWASDFLPNEIKRKDENLQRYYKENGSNLLLDYAAFEMSDGKRTVVETEHWIAVVPYWAAWPFETILMPKSIVHRMNELTEEMQGDLALALKKLTSRYDNLFKTSFPYSMGWHFAPFFKDGQSINHWQLHAQFYPPLLRSSSVRKFMVGYEMLAETQRDLTPEQAAEKLRAVSDIHYKN